MFTELEYLNLFGFNAHPKSDNEIASVDATVYQRVNLVYSCPKNPLVMKYLIYFNRIFYCHKITLATEACGVVYTYTGCLKKRNLFDIEYLQDGLVK